MPETCDWCGGEAPVGWDRCAACKALEAPFFNTDSSQRPTAEQRADASSLVDASRGLSVDQMMVRLAAAFPDYRLPTGFRSARGATGMRAEHVAASWRIARDVMRLRGQMPQGVFLLPDGFLHVDPNGEISIDGISTPGPLPMRDICEWLSSPERVGAIRSWPFFLLALSCCCRKLRRLDDEMWAWWIKNQGWLAIDVPEPSLTMEFRGPGLHPFLQLIGLRSDREPDGENSLGSIARASQGDIEEVGGDLSSAWLRILEDRDEEEYARMFSTGIAPRLVVDENERLRLIVLHSGTPTTVPVIIDAKVWRTLVFSLLCPEGHVGANLAKHIFWVWESQGADWRPTLPQTRSARFLRETIDSLGRHSSIYPVVIRREIYGIRVTGVSGIVYVIYPSDDNPDKFVVYALPSTDSLHAASRYGIQICIDPMQEAVEQRLPSGDIAASYVLALRHDMSSKHQIITLGAFLDVCKLTTETYGFNGDKEAWWVAVVENYGLWGEGEFHPGFEGEPIELEPEPEPDYEPDYESDFDSLPFEGLEGAIEHFNASLSGSGGDSS